MLHVAATCFVVCMCTSVAIHQPHEATRTWAACVRGGGMGTVQLASGGYAFNTQSLRTACVYTTQTGRSIRRALVNPCPRHACIVHIVHVYGVLPKTYHAGDQFVSLPRSIGIEFVGGILCKKTPSIKYVSSSVPPIIRLPTDRRSRVCGPAFCSRASSLSPWLAFPHPRIGL